MKYYLHNKNKDGTQSIFLELPLVTVKILQPNGKYKYRAIRYRAYTGEKINPKCWDSEQQVAKGKSQKTDDLNEFLNKLENQVIAIKRDARLNGEQLSADYFREKLLLKKENAKPKFSLIECLEKYIEDHKHSLAVRTLDNFRTLKSDLIELAEHVLYPVSFQTMNDELHLKFQAFLYREKGNTDNTFAKKTEKLKTFLRWATAAGYNENMAFEKFKAPRKKKDIIWLSDYEICLLEECKDLSPALKKTRDVFLFGCYTGMRYSDIQNLKAENVITVGDEKYLDFVMIKVKKQLTIPLIEQAEWYLNLYNKGTGSIFNCVSNQEMNDNLKLLGEIAKINIVVERVRFQGAKRIEKSRPKWSFLSTHCARHSYAINSLQGGMQPEILQKNLGHADLEETMGYVVIAQRFLSDHIRDVWKRAKTRRDEKKGI